MARRSNHALDIRIWDVEHGSAVYMNAGSKNVVIDCGKNTGDNEWSPLRWINDSRFGVDKIDYLIISHPHHDHIEDLDVMDELGLEPKILMRPKSATELVEENLEEARDLGREDYVEDAEYYLETLDTYDGDVDTSPSNPEWVGVEQNLGVHRADGGIPDRGVTFHNYDTGDPTLGNDNYEKLNNLSRVTVVNSYGFQYVTMGDLMPKGIEEIKDDQSAMAAIEDSEVLVAPHHGRESCFDKELVEHINPDLVVFSDMSGTEHSATQKYREIANGMVVEHEDTGNKRTRSVVTTRSDGRIRIQASRPDSWEVTVYGRDYSSQKANSKRYQKIN